MTDRGLGLVPIAPEEAPGPAGDTGSPFDALKARRQELFDARDRVFVVPGYENLPVPGGQVGDLVAKYRRLDVEAFREAMFGPADDEVTRNAQFLIDALQGLYWQVGTPDGGKRLIALTDGEESGWHDLAAQLGVDLGPDVSAVDQLVDGVFAGNDVAMTDHAGDVGRWMQSGQRKADQDFLGGH